MMPLRDPATPVEPSFKAKEVLERPRRWTGSGKKTNALKTLPSKYVVTDLTCYPPLFQYGFGPTYQRLLDYALQHNLVEVPENRENEDPQDIRGGLIIYALIGVMQYFQRVCRLPLTFLNPILLDYTAT